MICPTIVVVAYDRVNSLRRLLFSLTNAVFEEIPLLIFSIEGGAPKEIVETVQSYEWRGKKRIITHSHHLGLKEHNLFCGGLTEEYESVIVLEDDLFVSPYFYDYAQKVVDFYSDENQIAGISLYQYEYIENTDMPFRAINNGLDTYCIQTASSWGQIWNKVQWNHFMDWYQNNKIWESNDLRLPADVLKWPDTSWKKYFIKYLVDTNKFFVYPNISLTTNFGDSGTHNGYDNSLHQVNLLVGKKIWNFASISEAVKYDVNFNLLDISAVTSKFETANAGSSMHPIELNFLMGLEDTEGYLNKKKNSDYEIEFNLSGRRIQSIQNELPSLRKQIWLQLRYWFTKKMHLLRNGKG